MGGASLTLRLTSENEGGTGMPQCKNCGHPCSIWAEELFDGLCQECNAAAIAQELKRSPPKQRTTLPRAVNVCTGLGGGIGGLCAVIHSLSAMQHMSQGVAGVLGSGANAAGSAVIGSMVGAAIGLLISKIQKE